MGRFLIGAASVSMFALNACVSDQGLHTVGAPDSHGYQLEEGQVHTDNLHAEGVAALAAIDAKGNIIPLGTADIRSAGEIAANTIANLAGPAIGGAVNGALVNAGVSTLGNDLASGLKNIKLPSENVTVSVPSTAK